MKLSPEEIERRVAAYRCLLEDEPGIPQSSHGWIQWKGTSVCMDIRLLCCGLWAHVDTDFLYAVQCPKCGQLYEVSSDVLLNPTPPEDESLLENAQHNARHFQDWTKCLPDGRSPVDDEISEEEQSTWEYRQEAS